MLSSSAERRLSPASSPGGSGVGSMIGGSGGGGISFPSKGAGKTFEVLWAFQLPLEAVIIGLGSALDNLGWRVVDKERKWTDGQEGKDRILAHVISYLGLLEFVFDFNAVTKPQGETTYVRAIGQPSFPDPSQARRLLHQLYHALPLTSRSSIGLRMVEIPPQFVEMLVHATRPTKDGGLAIKDRRWHLKTHHYCFVGKECVDWVMNYTGYSRERSIAACRELAERRVLMHVDRKKKFKDGRFFYRFQTVYAEDEDAFEEAMKEVEDQGRKIRAELASTRNNVRISKDIWPLVSFSISRSTEESIEDEEEDDRKLSKAPLSPGSARRKVQHRSRSKSCASSAAFPSEESIISHSAETKAVATAAAASASPASGGGSHIMSTSSGMHVRGSHLRRPSDESAFPLLMRSTSQRNAIDLSMMSGGGSVISSPSSLSGSHSPVLRRTISQRPSSDYNPRGQSVLSIAAGGSDFHSSSSSSVPSPTSSPGPLARGTATTTSSPLSSSSAATQRVKKLKFAKTTHEIKTNGSSPSPTSSAEHLALPTSTSTSSSAPSSFPSLSSVNGSGFSTSPASPSLLSPLGRSVDHIDFVPICDSTLQNIADEEYGGGAASADAGGSGAYALVDSVDSVDTTHHGVHAQTSVGGGSGVAGMSDSGHVYNAGHHLLDRLGHSIPERFSSPDLPAVPGQPQQPQHSGKKANNKRLNKTTSSSHIERGLMIAGGGSVSAPLLASLDSATTVTSSSHSSPSLPAVSSSPPSSPSSSLSFIPFSQSLAIPLGSLQRRKSSSTPPSPQRGNSPVMSARMPMPKSHTADYLPVIEGGRRRGMEHSGSGLSLIQVAMARYASGTLLEKRSMALSAPNSPPSVRGDASAGGLSSSKDKEKKSLLRLTGRRKKDKERSASVDGMEDTSDRESNGDKSSRRKRSKSFKKGFRSSNDSDIDTVDDDPAAGPRDAIKRSDSKRDGNRPMRGSREKDRDGGGGADESTTTTTTTTAKSPESGGKLASLQALLQRGAAAIHYAGEYPRTSPRFHNNQTTPPTAADTSTPPSPRGLTSPRGTTAASRPNGTHLSTDAVDTVTLMMLAGGMAGGASVPHPHQHQGQGQTQQEASVDEDTYRRLFEHELMEVNRVKKRVSKMLKKKAKEDKRRREAERVYSDLNKDQSVRKLAKVFGESSERLPTGYGCYATSYFEEELASASSSGRHLTAVGAAGAKKGGKGNKEEKREREKEKDKEKDKEKAKRKKRRGEKSEGKRTPRGGGGALPTVTAAASTATTTGGERVSTSSSGDDDGAVGGRAWDVLSGREDQDKSWLREVMDERKKLAADKRKSQEATLPPKSPRLVNLTVSDDNRGDEEWESMLQGLVQRQEKAKRMREESESHRAATGTTTSTDASTISAPAGPAKPTADAEAEMETETETETEKDAAAASGAAGRGDGEETEDEEDVLARRRRQAEEQVRREEEEERAELVKLHADEVAQVEYLKSQVKMLISRNYELKIKVHENKLQTHILKSSVQTQLGEYMGGAVEADTEETKNSSSDEEEEEDDDEEDDDDDDDDDEDDDEEDDEDDDEEDDDDEDDEGEELATEDDDDDPDSEWRSIHSTRTIPFEDIEFAEPIGYGAFGAVNRAIWRGANVAVKKLILELNPKQVQEFIHEAKIMERVSNHPNVAYFCGVTLKPYFCIVSEYYCNGTVIDYLKKHPDAPWDLIVSMAIGAAAGVLHLHKEKIIHRDLAARNLLLDSNCNVHVTDFGLARAVKAQNYGKTTGGLGAIKWLAPEAITTNRYDQRTEAYSFSIVMWELVTRGKEPYEGEDPIPIALGVTQEYKRPPVPPGCPPKWRQLMEDCWEQDPLKRPTFEDIWHRLHECFEGGGKRDPLASSPPPAIAASAASAVAPPRA